MTWLGIALLILAAFCLVAFVASVGRHRREQTARSRLRSLAVRLQNPQNAPGEDTILRDRLGASGFHLDEALERIPYFRRLELLLYRAGFGFAAWRLAAFSLFAGLLAAALGIELLHSYGAGALLAATVMALPWTYVVWRKRRRMRLFELQFPEALELICRALRAGHALSAGMRMVGESLEDPIGCEFAHVADEIALGLDVREALRNLCHRIDVPDLAFFSTAVLIQRETGGNLAEIMEKLGYVIRERHKLQGKIKAMTAQNRGAAMILLFTPLVFVLLMNRVRPDFVDPLWTTDAGRTLGLVVAAMTIGGFAIARRLAVVRA